MVVADLSYMVVPWLGFVVRKNIKHWNGLFMRTRFAKKEKLVFGFVYHLI